MPQSLSFVRWAQFLLIEFNMCSLSSIFVIIQKERGGDNVWTMLKTAEQYLLIRAALSEIWRKWLAASLIELLGQLEDKSVLLFLGWCQLLKQGWHPLSACAPRAHLFLVGFSTINQGCTICGIQASWLQENRERMWKWRGNGERMRKWMGNGERMRKWKEIHSLHFLIFS